MQRRSLKSVARKADKQPMRETPQEVADLLRFRKSLIQLCEHNNSASLSPRAGSKAATPQSREIEVLVRKTNPRQK